MNTGTALGLPDTVPGIAVARHDTLGGYFLMKTQGKTFVTRQVDYGPAGWTGRVWDMTAAEVKRQKLKDPTNRHGSLIYLGKNKARAHALAQQYMGGTPNTQLGKQLTKTAPMTGVPGTPAGLAQFVQQARFSQAQPQAPLLASPSFAAQSPMPQLQGISGLVNAKPPDLTRRRRAF